MGYAASCNLKNMEPGLSEFLDVNCAIGRRPRWQLPQIEPPMPNEIIATYTSAQSASDTNTSAFSNNYAGNNDKIQMASNVWLDGVTVLSCSFYDTSIQELVDRSDEGNPHWVGPGSQDKAARAEQIPSLYPTVMMLCFTPDTHAVSCSGHFETGRIFKCEVGSHIPLR